MGMSGMVHPDGERLVVCLDMDDDAAPHVELTFHGVPSRDVCIRVATAALDELRRLTHYTPPESTK